MNTKTDFRDLIVDCPACRAKVQLEHMDGATYTDYAALLRSVRSGSVVRVYRPFLLGGGKGRTDRQRNLWATRADEIKAKGATLASVHPPLTGHRLTMRAYEEIGNVARGKAGKHKIGRPTLEYTPEQMRVIERYWPRRAGMTIEQAKDEINKRIAPRRVTAGWLYANVK
jgi:hypothetical protein